MMPICLIELVQYTLQSRIKDVLNLNVQTPVYYSECNFEQKSLVNIYIT